MTTPGNAGFAPLQVQYIENVAEDKAIDIASMQILPLVLENVAGYSERDFFIFHAPYPGKILSGTAMVGAPFSTSNLLIKIRKGTGREGETPPVFTDIVNGVMTIPHASSGDGSNASCTPSDNNTFAEGEFISVNIDGGGKIEEADVPGTVSLVLERTNL